MKILKGETLEEQMKSADRLLNKFSRRLHKTVKAIITPYPISNYVDVPVHSAVLKYMFPTDGEILLGLIYVEQMPKDGVDIFTTVSLNGGVKSEQFFTDRNSMSIQPNVAIEIGSRLTVSIKAKGEGKVSGVWVSFLWVPHVKDAVIKKFLIDELESVGEEYALLEEE